MYVKLSVSMKSESKSWQRFEGKIRSLKQNLQLVDLSLKLANRQCTHGDDSKTIASVLGSSTQKRRQLNIPNKTIDINRTFVAARKQMNEQAFIELHCLFSDYIAHVISEIAHTQPQRLLSILGNDAERALSFADIVSLGNYDSVINEMAKRVFRILENLRSTSDMVERLCKITKIKIKEELKNDALIYIEVRHLIIHGDSIADGKFKTRDKNHLIPLQGNKLALRYNVTNRAINSIYELCRSIDNALIEKSIIPIRKQL